jgi:hypothetical protein
VQPSAVPSLTVKLLLDTELALQLLESEAADVV